MMRFLEYTYIRLLTIICVDNHELSCLHTTQFTRFASFGNKLQSHLLDLYGMRFIFITVWQLKQMESAHI